MRINGTETPLGGLKTVADLLAARGLNPQRVAVERNGAIVPRAAFSQTALAEEDCIELVAFVGGG